MNGLSLCAGIGGLDLGLHLAQPGYRTVCYVEIEPFCQDILLARMADGVLDRAPIWGDLRRFDTNPWRGAIQIVHGGYPCQPFSVAGKRAGTDDPRHLWPDIARIVRSVEPTWCFFENVAGHLTLGFDVVARDLETMDYRVAAGLFTAAEVGAPHRRQRLYILARRYERHGMADARCGGEYKSKSGWQGGPCWPPSPLPGEPYPKPGYLGVAHGLPRRVDRLKALGNAVVPDVAALAWRELKGNFDGR